MQCVHGRRMRNVTIKVDSMSYTPSSLVVSSSGVQLLSATLMTAGAIKLADTSFVNFWGRVISSAEVIVGYSLAFALRPSFALLFSRLTLIALLGFDFLQLIRGSESCGCFGTTTTSPFVTVLLLASLLGLVFQGVRRIQSVSRIFLATCLLTWSVSSSALVLKVLADQNMGADQKIIDAIGQFRTNQAVDSSVSEFRFLDPQCTQCLSEFEYLMESTRGKRFQAAIILVRNWDSSLVLEARQSGIAVSSQVFSGHLQCVPMTVVLDLKLTKRCI
jgi:hypothetical protein